MDYVVAFCLIFLPVDWIPHENPIFRDALLQYLIREDWIANRAELDGGSFFYVWRLAQIKHALQEELPPSSTRHLFLYDPDFIRSQLGHNRKHEELIEQLLLLSACPGHSQWLGECQQETARRHRIWWALLGTYSDGYNSTLLDRRRSLAELLFLLGPERFYAGVIPPAVPVEHLRRIP
jgi:hypothetical protein